MHRAGVSDGLAKLQDLVGDGGEGCRRLAGAAWAIPYRSEGGDKPSMRACIRGFALLWPRMGILKLQQEIHCDVPTFWRQFFDRELSRRGARRL